MNTVVPVLQGLSGNLRSSKGILIQTLTFQFNSCPMHLDSSKPKLKKEKEKQ